VSARGRYETPVHIRVSYYNRSPKISSEHVEKFSGFKVETYVEFMSRNKKTSSVDLSPLAKYTDWATTTCLRNSVTAFVDRGVSRGQRGGFPTVVI
jgi:hypothetical protein